jgi:alpha-beta hydrolase superfamily lysophospholipase
LAEHRNGEAKDRPIIFIAHSLGGLIVKNTLVQASASVADCENHLKPIQLSTIYVPFFGTPHRAGLHLYRSRLLNRIITISRRIPLAQNFDPLPSQAELFEMEIDRYKSVEESFQNYSSYEASTSKLADQPHSLHAVLKELALPLKQGDWWHSYELNRNHGNLVKFTSREDPECRRVFESIPSCLSDRMHAAQKL